MELASYEVIFEEGHSPAVFVDYCPIYRSYVFNPLLLVNIAELLRVEEAPELDV
jgi:hypothetical protein